jgi:hypothetical protein
MKVIYFNIILITAYLLSINNSQAQTYGCTDPLGTNYNPSAIINDGSCLYNASSVIPSASLGLVSSLRETSGLIRWNNQLWTQNDNEDINIYALDTLNGNIIQSYPLTGTFNKDWEEISQDNDYIYIGDFGNNSNGNRKDLKILRIWKNSILVNPVIIDTINFYYSDQTDFTPTGSNNTDFDCEAFIVSSDSIYLFTKQWVSQKTCVYSIPKTPGTHTAKNKATYNAGGLITGATYLKSKKLIVLCGYSKLLEPFIYLLYDFNGTDYFSGNKRKIAISLSYHQIEGIATVNGLKYYLSNEYFTYPPFLSVPQKLHILNLNSYLENYLNSVTSAVNKTETNDNYLVYPVPADNFIIVNRGEILQDENYSLINFTGQTVLAGKLTEEENSINISTFPGGFYILKVAGKMIKYYKVIKR